MAKQTWKFARTSNMVRVFIQDSSVTTGAGLTGAAYNTSGLVIDLIANNSNTAYHYKSAATATIEDITTIGTFAAPSASNCRFKAVDGTNFPGLYEIQFLDGLFDDANCTSVIGRVAGVTNMVPTFFEIQLVAYDPDDAAGLGLSRIDAAVTSRLAPTTASRTLDVSATGEAGIDWANIGSPTTAVNLSGTNIDVDQVVASVSGAVGSVTGAVGSVTGAVGSVTGAVGSVTGAVGSVTGNVGGNVTGSVGSVATGGISAASFAAGAIDAASIAADAGTEIGTAVWATTTRQLTGTQTFNVTGNITGNLSGSVGSVTGNVGGSVASVATGGIAAASFAAGAIDAAALAADAGTEIGTAVWASATRTLTSGAVTQVHLFGGWGKSGSTYYWQGAVAIDGSLVTSGISSLAVVGVYGNNANTDLGYVVGTAPTVGTSARLYGSFTLTTAPTDGQPAVLEITFVYNATTYRGRLYSWGIA